MNIIDFLNNYFKKEKITQKQIESMTGISQDKVSLVLNRKRKLTAEELVKIIIAFDLDIKKELSNKM
jgi:predicted XRE-type DNA-binding protein